MTLFPVSDLLTAGSDGLSIALQVKGDVLSTQLKTGTINLFDKEVVDSGKYLVTGGAATNDASFFITDYIPVKQGEIIWFSSQSSSSIAGIGFYLNEQYVSFTPCSTAKLKLDIPEGVDSIRCSGLYATIDKWMITKTMFPSIYKPYSMSLTEIFDRQLTDLKSSVVSMFSTNIYKKNFIEDYYISDTGVITSAAGWAWSGLLPASPNTRYTRNPVVAGGNQLFRTIWFYDSNVELLGNAGSVDTNLLSRESFTTPDDCYYIGVNLREPDNWDITASFNVVEFGQKASNNIFEDIYTNTRRGEGIGTIVKSTDKYIYSSDPIGSANNIDAKIAAVYENHVIFRSGLTLYYSNHGVKDGFSPAISLVFNDTNFPSLYPDSDIEDVVIFQASTKNIRSLVFTNKNQIYHSIGETLGSYQLSSVWALPGEEFKHISSSEKDPTNTRYKYHTPSNIADRNRYFSWMGGNIWVRGLYGGFIFGNYPAPNTVSENTAPVASFFTIDGLNIYAMYMFGIEGRRVKKAGTTEYFTTPYAYGNPLNTSGFASDYQGGLTVKARTNIVPSSLELEPPAIFEFSMPVNVIGFTKGNPSVATVADSTNLIVGDVVCFDGDATDAEWNALRNQTATTTNGGNGKFYIITAKNGDAITLAEAIGNPNNNLTCTHIHSISEAANGFIIGTGEEYPHSWLIRCQKSNAPTDVKGLENFRINSSELGVQRTLGVYLRSDNKLLFSSDTPNVKIKLPQITGRTEEMEAYSAGLWLGDITDVDDWSKFGNKLWGASSAYLFRRIGNALIYCSQFGETFISFDEGDTWEHVVTDDSSKPHLIGFDLNRNRFYFDPGNKVIELV